MVNLVTGGAGFLGSKLVNALVDDGESVIIVDNLSSGYMRNLEYAISSGRATFVYADVATPYPAFAALLKAATKKRVHRIFHLASPAGPASGQRRAWSTLEADALGTMSLIEFALAHQARFVFASSAGVSGCGVGPTYARNYLADYEGAISCDVHEEAKRFGELAVEAATYGRGLAACVVRLLYCYGPGMDELDGTMVTEFFNAVRSGGPIPIRGNGAQTLPMAYVGDAVRALRSAIATSDDAAPQAVRLTEIDSGDVPTIEEIARAVARAAGVRFSAVYLPARTAPGASLQSPLPVGRAWKISTSTALDDGLRATYRWLHEGRLAFA